MAVREARGSTRPAEGQVDAMATQPRVVPLLERHYPVVAKTGRASPDDHVAMAQPHALGLVAPARASEQEDGRKSQGDGHDGRVEGPFVLVLVQGHLRSRLVTIDETGIGHESLEARLGPRIPPH